MNVKRFVARNVREALQDVRYTFGNDAIILSNKSIPGGVEIIAVPAEDMLAEASRREQDRLDKDRREQELRRAEEQRKEKERLQAMQEARDREEKERSLERERSRNQQQDSFDSFKPTQPQPRSSSKPQTKQKEPPMSWTRMQFASEDYSVDLSNIPAPGDIPGESLGDKARLAKEIIRTSSVESTESTPPRPAPGTKAAAIGAYTQGMNEEPFYYEQESPKIEMTQARTLQEQTASLKAGLSQQKINLEDHPEHNTETNPSFARKSEPIVPPGEDAFIENKRATDIPKQSELAQHLAQQLEEKADTTLPGAVMQEIRGLRKVVEEHLSGLAWGEAGRSQPVKTDLLRHMLDLGFSPKLCRDMLQDLPMEMDVNTATAWIKGSTDRSLFTIDANDDIVDIGGVYALVGPTGVGKTTTTAKLAARCVLKHGPNKMALITTDSYRVGAHEQLKIYGRILGVPVHSVKDDKELAAKLEELSSKHLILIDTMGMSQNDKNVLPLISMLETCDVQRLLLLPATSHAETLDDIIKSYARYGLSGCILTKIDESTGLGTILDAIMRHELLLHYVCNGQRVPEDLHMPNKTYLIHRAFRELSEDSPHRLIGDEAGMVMANSRVLPNPPQNYSLQ